MKNIKRIFLISLIVFILSVLWYFIFRGFKMYDEGWILYATSRLTHGETIYKDFQFIYNPGVLYANAVFFKIFGESIFTSRLLAYFNALLSMLILYKISKNLRLPNLLIIFVIINFLFWGPIHINFVWPVMFSISSGLLAVLFIQKAINSKDKNKMIFLAGIFSAICFIFKQNFGVAIILTSLFAFFSIKSFQNIKSLSSYLTGYILIILIISLYMVFNNSLIWYLKDMYLLMVGKVLTEGVLTSALPWQYPGNFIAILIKTLLYLLPLILSIWAIITSYKKQKNVMFIFSFTLFFYLLSIRPTTDIIHLAPLLAISGIPFAYLITQTQRIYLKSILIILAILIMFLGLQNGLFEGYYKWGTPIQAHGNYLNSPKGGIYVENPTLDTLKLANFVDRNFSNEKYIFVYNFSPFYYFIANKENPTRYDYAQTILTLDERREIINILKEKNIKHLVIDFDLSLDPSILANYIKSEYKPIKNYPNLGAQIWERKN